MRDRMIYKIAGVTLIILAGLFALVGTWANALMGGLAPNTVSAYAITSMIFSFVGVILCTCGWG